MNTLMWEHQLTVQHLRQLAGADAPVSRDPAALVDWINVAAISLHVVPPQSKRLACGDVGVGAIADVKEIVQVVQSALLV
jgi:phosphopantothenoylcysteine decarboxylase